MTASRRKDPQADVSFNVTATERATIHAIAQRAFTIAKDFGCPRKAVDFAMDVTAAHANGNPLRLADLLAADDFNFIHDVFGIERHIDRDTGKLGNCFSPRFSQRAA